jgi:phospholipid/cholesterol/gamma-HCH transport system substrate-binding protein
MAAHSKYSRGEILAGLVVLAAALLVAYFAMAWTNRNLLNGAGYIVYADFVSVAGLYEDDPVEIAGVQVGTVESVTLADFQARVALRLKESVTLHDDATATIKQDWFVGTSRISINPGTSAKPLSPGDKIKRTESPTTIHDLVGELLTGKLLSNGP